MKTIIAIGGGSFQKQETIHIDRYALSRCRSKVPKVLFLPTASKDDQGYAKRFKQYYRSLGCEVTALRLFHTKLSQEAVHALLRQQDLVYLGGGDTIVLMEMLKRWGLDKVLPALANTGVVVCGCSAGANVMFSYGYSNIIDQGYALVQGMGLVSGVFCPHAQSKERQGFLAMAEMAAMRGVRCFDGQAWIMEDDREFLLE